jgi:hypothetical protein
MDLLVWDHYPKGMRITLTVICVLTAGVMICSPVRVWAFIPILLGAIAFHTEYRLSIDASSGSYEIRSLVKPFGVPERGPRENIKHVYVSMSTAEHGVTYSAQLVLVARKYESSRTFPIASGSLDRVLDEVAKVVKATNSDVIESAELIKAREGFDSLVQLLHKNRLR